MSSNGSSKGSDLWSIIANERNVNAKDDVSKSTTSIILFVGDAGSGKSTLIQSFLKPTVTKEPKPTFALEYAFARRKVTTSGSTSTTGKTVAHIWELGT